MNCPKCQKGMTEGYHSDTYSYLGNRYRIVSATQAIKLEGPDFFLCDHCKLVFERDEQGELKEVWLVA